MTTINSQKYKDKDITWYNKKNLMLNNLFEKYEPYDFYRTIFPKGSFQTREEKYNNKANGIIVYAKEDATTGDSSDIKWNHIVFDDFDDFEEVIIDSSFAIMSPISYLGRNRTSHNARYCYGIVIDIDGVDNEEYLLQLLHQCELPISHPFSCGKPTFIVNSGHGLHFYYLFDKPIEMFQENQKELNKLKNRLTWLTWTQGGSSLSKKVQYQSINQGYRMPGSQTKFGKGYNLIAYKYGDKWSIEKLNILVGENYAANVQYSSKMSLDEAKKKYPNWYENSVVNKKKNRWYIKRDLYDWWKRELLDKIEEGHRYFGIMTLAIIAQKCKHNPKSGRVGVTYEELKRDAFELGAYFEKKTIDDTNHFTNVDIVQALQIYENDIEENYVTFPKDTISKLTNILMPYGIKRNGRPQEEHLEEARLLRDFRFAKKGKRWDENNGRKKGSVATVETSSKARIIMDYLKEHPEATKAEIIRATGLTKPTVYKWYNLIKNKKEVLNKC